MTGRGGPSQGIRGECRDISHVIRELDVFILIYPHYFDYSLISRFKTDENGSSI